ncbi:hypothetical protein ERO13_A02G163432v2 [Gossypium hirsutum]|uniref:UPF0496 protein At2g18630 n=2 Tax=Gossypium TaxID=3633 RepID=A0ABM2Z1Y7_GOSHI|nr:UPF0496 protein At2g18630-like [Gossypium hirsutum]KAG4212407.1 hypothetical protein ERO13_A02G163432v2 [Gossypium hirsutum]TYJ47340.1 hypothetical protein E1A91_A02G182800v1 [Gossypium mustelinum]
MASSISSEPSFIIEVQPDSRSEAGSSLNRVANSDSDTLPNRTHNVINSLAVDSNLKSFMKEYFDNLEKTPEFCTVFKDSLEHDRNNHGIIESAVKCYEDKLEVGTVEKNSVEALEELRRFKAAEESFVQKFLEQKRMAHMRYESMQGKVCARKKTLEKKVESWETWRRVSVAFLVAAFISMLVFSVVAVIISAKPVITTLAGALTTAIVPLGTWCNKYWKRNKEKIKEKKKLTAIMEIYGSSATTIWMQVEELEIKKTSLSHSVDCVLTEGYTLKVGMDDINEKLKHVTSIITDLLRETDGCRCKFRTDWEGIQRQMMLML